MGFRKSPSIVASGAMGVATGVAIAGGLLFALAMPSHAASASQPAAQVETLKPAATHTAALPAS